MATWKRNLPDPVEGGEGQAADEIHGGKQPVERQSKSMYTLCNTCAFKIYAR